MIAGKPARHIYFLSVHPQFINSYLSLGVMSRAVKAGSLNLHSMDLRDFAVDQRGSVDDRPFGGGDGMVLRPEPLADAVKSLEKRPKIIIPSPRGVVWHQEIAKKFAESEDDLLFVCGRFSGIDQRFIDNYADYEFSLGDFIVSGGELPGLIMADSIIRYLPGALGDQESATNDSFAPGCFGLLEHDLYTRPKEFEGIEVPHELLGGNHHDIQKWRQKNSMEVTDRYRPDLKKGSPFRKSYSSPD